MSHFSMMFTSHVVRRLLFLANNGQKVIRVKETVRPLFFPLQECYTTSVTKHSKNIEIKKRVGKKKNADEVVVKKGYWSVSAYCTGEEYHLEALGKKMLESDIFERSGLSKELPNPDFMHLAVKQENDCESQEVFIFSEGAVVAWNLPDIDVEALLSLLKKHQTGEYTDTVIRSESEAMNYTYGNNSTILVEDDFIICKDNPRLEKYAVSNAMALSVKLGTWETSLANYIESMEEITEDMKKGRKIKISEAEVMRKTGKNG